MCDLNRILSENKNLRPSQVVETCWNLVYYNSDNIQTSGLYMNAHDKRCALVLSGFHATAHNYMQTGLALSFPPERWPMCGNEMYAPVVKLTRHHTALGNWSKMARFLAGPKCSSITVIGESLGGSAAEILAACSGRRELGQLQHVRLPHFKVSEVFTFGAFPSAEKPITNVSAPNRCVAGRRVVHANDLFAQWTSTLGLKHPAMDTIVMFEAARGWNYTRFRCFQKEATSDDGFWAKIGIQVQTPTALLKSEKAVDAIAAHTIPRYISGMRYLMRKPRSEAHKMVDYAHLLRSAQHVSLRERDPRMED